MAIVRYRDENGNIVPIRVIRGEKGESLIGTNCESISKDAAAAGNSTLAGSKGFRITASSGTSGGTGTYTLEGYDGGYAKGDIYTIRIDYYYDRNGEITAIDGNVITVNNFVADALVEDFNDDEDVNTFRVADKPTIGNLDIGVCATAFGNDTLATGRYSHAEGSETKAEGKHSHAEGKMTEAVYSSHAEGRESKALGQISHAEGWKTTASGDYSHTEGHSTEATGDNAHAEGNETWASGTCAHAEGYQSKAEKSFAHVEGKKARACGESSHAEGDGTYTGEAARGAHAEGVNTKAEGVGSHAQGFNVLAKADMSSASGDSTEAHGKRQAVFGKYNKRDTEGKYAFIIGNGTGDSDEERSNAYAVDWDGNAFFAGKITATSLEFGEGGTPPIVSGTYTGNGTLGENGGVTLNFPFAPKFLYIQVVGNGVLAYGHCALSTYYDAGVIAMRSNINPTYLDTILSSDGKTIYFSSGSDAEFGLNATGTIYGYVAIG